MAVSGNQYKKQEAMGNLFQMYTVGRGGGAGSEGWPFDLNLARQIRFPLAGKEPEGPSRKRNQHVRKHGDEKV